MDQFNFGNSSIQPTIAVIEINCMNKSNIAVFDIRLPLFISAGLVLCNIFANFIPRIEINVEVVPEEEDEEEDDEEDNIDTEDDSEYDVDSEGDVAVLDEYREEEV